MYNFILKGIKCNLTIKDIANIYFSSMEIPGFWAKFTAHGYLVSGYICTAHCSLAATSNPAAEELSKLACVGHPTNAAVMCLIICNTLQCEVQCLCSLALQCAGSRLLPSPGTPQDVN